MVKKLSLEEQIVKELDKKKSAEEELSLVEKLQEDLKKRKAEVRKKLREEKEVEAIDLGKKLYKTYKTTDLIEIKETIFNEYIIDQGQMITIDNFNYLTRLAEELRKDTFVDYKKVFKEIQQRF
ncbi:hypothetical protein ACTHQ4_20855 [Alkalicoccobacillus gibsonii]|uniref:hypothetical protein n=1 Tax=Alkalicoccobacillus gibsonii TaxID=79881 RepID=UPI003F7BD90C